MHDFNLTRKFATSRGNLQSATFYDKTVKLISEIIGK